MSNQWLAKFRALSPDPDVPATGAKSVSSATSSIESGLDAAETIKPATNGAIGTFGTQDPKFAEETIGTSAEVECLSASAWRDLYEERAAHREFDGGHKRVVAERLAWAELENRWNLLYGERVPHTLCAGCRHPIGDVEHLDLIDGSRVHTADDSCLIRHGHRWRTAARMALEAMGLTLPAATDSDERSGSLAPDINKEQMSAFLLAGWEEVAIAISDASGPSR
jgi:hypothetical protein